MRRIVSFIAILVLSALSCNLPAMGPSSVVAPSETPAANRTVDSPAAPAAAVPPLTVTLPVQISQVIEAAVQIVAVRQGGGDFEPLWSGSGTIISAEGRIITNCHVACGAPALVILVTTNPDLPPEPRYLAEVTHYDENLDLAILQITGDLDGNLIQLSSLTYLPVGNSDRLSLGDPIRIFGYPGAGGDTITFTSGSVSGFESATVGGVSQRVIIKTDAEISSGNSGGTAIDANGYLIGIPTWVNPDVREGVTIGGIGVLRPANLIDNVLQNVGAPPVDQASLPPDTDPDPYEPNDTYDTSKGPLQSGETITAYISWPDDVDAFFITTNTTQTVTVLLTDIPSGTDYDLFLLDETDVLASSDGETSQERIEFVPPAPGTYWIVIASYNGASTTSPYRLIVTYDSDPVSGGSTATGGIRVTGQVVNGDTGLPIAGGVFGLLQPGVTCHEFFSGPELNLNQVLATADTNSNGFFELPSIPRGARYTAFFLAGANVRACEDHWLNVPLDAADFDIGVLKVSPG